VLKRGPKSPMLTKTPAHVESLVVSFAKTSNLCLIRLAVIIKIL